MHKLKVLVGLFTIGSLAYTLQAYDRLERVQDMQTMESAMGAIQKGILYNNKKMVLQGVANLKSSSSKVEVIEKKEMNYSAKFAKSKAKNIIKFADKIQINIENGEKHAAATNYTEILNQCISCHNKIRKWRD